MPEVQRLAVSGVTGNVAHGELLEAAFEYELKKGSRADSAGPTDHAQFHQGSPRRATIGTPDRGRSGRPSDQKVGLKVNRRCRPRGRKRAVRASCQGYRAMVHYRLRPRE